ncbi:MAG: hypothetical protein EHM58_16375 [Ignavibacteriae bacterium]|nr:MAG: hypothetical protein EHM58_16375 [Ignavibacteriota bacterium]
MNKLFIKAALSFLLVFISISSVQSQPKLIIQLSGGLALPMDQTKGNFSGMYVGYNTTGIDTSFLKSNMGADIGFAFNGALKFGIDKYGITRGILTASFNSFFNNASGYLNENGYLFPAKYDWNLNFANFGAGLEVAPLSKYKFTPFVNAAFVVTVMSANLRAQSSSIPDETNWLETVRLGVSGNAGIEIKTSKNFGIVVGANYTIHNLLFKDNDNFNHANFGKNEIGFNDKGGLYFSNMYEGGFSKPYVGSEKKLTSVSFYAGITLYMDMNKKTPPKTTTKK